MKKDTLVRRGAVEQFQRSACHWHMAPMVTKQQAIFGQTRKLILKQFFWFSISERMHFSTYQTEGVSDLMNQT